MAKPTLDDILGGPDPLGILADEGSVSAPTSVDDRAKAGFEEINQFLDRHGREPGLADGTEFAERGLARRLDTIRNNPSMVAALTPLDRHKLLVAAATSHDSELLESPKSIDEILDEMDEESEEGGIFDLTHVKPNTEIGRAEYTAQRKPCRDFEKFKPLFEKASKELELGVRKTTEFKIEKQIAKGQFFILKGLIAYVAEEGETFIKNGKENSRIRTIFSNGTELNNLRRSLAKELYRDPNGRRVTDPQPGILFGGQPQATDVGTGTIYVLRSCSTDPGVIKYKGILHKIGVTSASVERRIANAENESTYLLAPVEIVATYELFNINSTKLENLLHRYFDAARADITIPDRFGKPVQPREWFFISTTAIRDAVMRLKDGTLPKSRYDVTTGKIVEI
jgi:hypothetical protein